MNRRWVQFISFTSLLLTTMMSHVYSYSLVFRTTNHFRVRDTSHVSSKSTTKFNMLEGGVSYSLPKYSYASPSSSATATTNTSRRRRMASSDFDFPSAMPEKPQLTMEQRMEQSSDDFIERMDSALGPGVEAPPELETLRQLRATKEDATPQELALVIYQLMIERGMRYDEAPETGILTPTEFNIPENLEVKEVQEEFGHLYRYGMMLMDRGLLTADQVKETVLERLIKRTGLSPEEFDTWLGY